MIVDADCPASFAVGCEAAAQALNLVQRKLPLQDLGARLPRVAARCGLVLHPEIGCHDAWQTCSGIQGVQHIALGFVGNFHVGDPALEPWRRIEESARLYLRRLSHVYMRPSR